MAEHEVTETTTRKIYVYPCVKCGCDDIEIYNCGYSSFNCAGGKCKKCGHKIETGASWNAKNSELIKAIAEEIKRLRKIKRRLQNAV